MQTRLVAAFLLGSMVLLRAEGLESPLAHADALIKWECEESGKWNEATIAFVRTLWADFRSAYQNPDDCGSACEVEGLKPSARSYDEYVGSYLPIERGSVPAFAIRKGVDGLFMMVVEDRALPVVCRNARLLIASGDVIPSAFAGLGRRLYGELEVWTLILAEGKYHFLASATDMAMAQRTELTRQEGK